MNKNVVIPVILIMSILLGLWVCGAATVDRRDSRHSVWKYAFTRMEWDPNDANAVTARLPISGIVRGFMVDTTPDANDPNVVFTLTFADADGYAIATKTALAVDANAFTEDNVWSDGNLNVVVEPNVGDANGLWLDLTVYGE